MMVTPVNPAPSDSLEPTRTTRPMSASGNAIDVTATVMHVTVMYCTTYVVHVSTTRMVKGANVVRLDSTEMQCLDRPWIVSDAHALYRRLVTTSRQAVS